ncbi:MAG: hypothetical protein ACT4PU_04045 [Planctomycetota bacterium]
MNDHLIDRLFRTQGRIPFAPESPSGCPTDETLAGYASALLPARARQELESHALRCEPCLDLLRAVAVTVGIKSAPRSVQIVARLHQRGLELLNQFELALQALVAPAPVPALGALRGPAVSATTDQITIRGPGHGLDELELQMQANGTARLVVRCHEPPELQPGELISVVLDVNGSAREKRPFSGEPIAFAPIGVGNYRVRLLARAPGQEVRELAEALLDFQS